MNTLSRRHFLKLSSATGLAASAGFGLVTSPTASAIEPFKRGGKARLYLSLAAYSFREFFKDSAQKQAPPAAGAKRIDLFDFVDYCAEHGCDGAELTGYYFPKDVTMDYVARLRRHCHLRGVMVSGTAIGNNFSHPKGPKRDEEIMKTKQWIDRAAVLGAPHIRVFAGVTKELSRDAADKLVIECLEECCDYAGQKGIFLGIENHDSIGTADALIDIIKQVKSKWLGVNLDSGNFRTENPYEDFARVTPYAVNVQIKSELRRKDAKESEPADLAKFVKILRDSGYQGFVALEYEAKPEPWGAVPPLLKQLKGMMS